MNNFLFFYFMNDELFSDYIVFFEEQELFNLDEVSLINKLTFNLSQYPIHQEIKYMLIEKVLDFKKKFSNEKMKKKSNDF